MAEYIEREALKKELEENAPYNWSNEDYEQGEVNGYKYAVSIVEAQDAADVAEVKHGKWKKRGNEKTCSCCKFIYYSNNDTWNYCPYCGARMDGDEV